MNKRKLFAGMASVAMAATLVGCSSESGSSAADTFTVGVTSEMAGVFSPLYYQTNEDHNVINLVYQSLLKYDAKNELHPELATDMPEVSEDGKTLTFHLKKGVKFSDGTDLTSSDVKYTFTVMADPSYTGRMSNTVEDLEGYKEYSQGDAKELTGVETPDEHTVVFHLANPRIDAVSNFGAMAICSDEQFEYTKGNTEEIEQSTDQPIGSGPYVLKTYDKATGASLTKNEKFTGEGEYAVKNIIIKKTDLSTEYDELKSGNVDLIPGVIEPSKVSQASTNDEITFNHYPRAGVGYVAFNCQNGATSDQAVRQALAYATDRAGFNDSYYGYDDKASDKVKDIKLGYQPQAYWNPASKNLGAYVRGEEKIDGLTEYNFDVEKAKSVLDAAGWTVGSDGVREKDGQKLELKFVATKDNSVLETLIPLMSKAYKEIGVDLKTTEVDFNTLVDMLTNDDQSKEWNAFFMATGYNGVEDTDSLLNFGYTVDADGNKVPTADNYPRLIDDELNSLLQSAYRTGDVEASKQDYLKAMQRSAELVSYLPIYGNEYFDLYNKRVEGLETGPVQTWSHAMEGVTLKAE